jgi:hypothetical protein
MERALIAFASLKTLSPNFYILLTFFFFFKVWWGHTDTAAVHYLETANEWNIGVMTSQESDLCAGFFNILSLFYDASGQLWKV